MRPASVLALALLATPALAGDAPEPDFAIRGCRVETVSGDAIENGVVVVRAGKIDAVGPAASTDVPPGLDVVDAEGKVLLPGFVHPASRLGLRGSGGGSSSTSEPDRSVQEAELTPWLEANFWSAGSGFTALGLVPGSGIIAGRGVAVRTAAPDAASAVLREDALVRVNVIAGSNFKSVLGGQLRAARKDLDTRAKYERDLAKWNEAKAKAEKEKKKKKPPTAPKEPKLDAKRESLRKVLRGEAALLAYAGNSAAVHTLAESLEDETTRGPDLRLYAFVSGDAHRAAGVLADLGATCLVRAGTANDVNTTEIVCPALLYRRAGARIILLPRSESRDGLRAFPLTLARTVRAGFPRAAALRAATLGPAEMLGIEKQAGSIEKGKRADLMLFSGSPLHAASRIETVWIAGARVEETP